MSDRGELRDIFAGLAMQALIGKTDDMSKTATYKWISNQAYKFADAMLDQRDDVSNNKENR